jgi:hypothetical protein
MDKKLNFIQKGDRKMKKQFKCLLILFISLQAGAVHLSTDNRGQVLLFPYYTVNGGYDTLINLVNTTAQTKALRVRFREAANGREVFALNVYLGPYDVWVAALTKGTEQQGYFTRILTPDLSCTTPAINNETVFFSKADYTVIFADAYGDSTNRLHEGFIEVIEMGNLTGRSEMAATIDPETGVADCQVLQDAWDAQSSDSYWIADASTDMLPPTGGIMGDVILIDVEDGLSISQDGIAIEDFSDDILNFSSDSELPNLANAKSESYVQANGSSHKLQWSRGIDAISALLMRFELQNEYALDAVIAAETDWLVSFPTKQFYTDPTIIGSSEPIPPFTTSMFLNNAVRRGCEPYGVSVINDREARNPVLPPGIGIPGSPPPPIQAIPSFCFSTNIITLGHENNPTTPVGLFDSYFPTGYADANGVVTGNHLVTPYENGWASLLFYKSMETPDGNSVLSGLPVIGFAVQRFLNIGARPGVLANYAVNFEHKSRVKLEQVTTENQDLKGMSIAKDNNGQVLIYPYYTVRNNLATLISVTNNSARAKAVRVAFYEGKNDREALAFNLYLSPFDVWTAALTSTEADPAIVGADFAGQQSVRLVTSDRSCTVPDIDYSGQEFLPFAFSGGFDDGLLQDMERVTEGHLEIIEMGNLTGSDADATVHDPNGVPSDCAGLNANWLPPTGKWLDDPSINLQAADGLGGLQGSVHIVGVEDGIDMSYDATAIIGFNTEIIHTSPGDLLPNLSSASTATTVIETDAGLFQTTWESPLNAVTALFMQAQVHNDYTIEPSINAQTEWVNFFPTRSFYTDPLFSQSEIALQPFAHGLLDEFDGCNIHRFSSYNREQRPNMQDIPMPPPPFGQPPNFTNRPSDCWSVVVSAAGQGDRGSAIFDTKLNLRMSTSDEFFNSIMALSFTNGWMQMDFVDDSVEVPGRLVGVGENGEVHEIVGKPVLGFVAQTYSNGTLTDTDGKAVLANYAIINKNKNKKTIYVR